MSLKKNTRQVSVENDIKEVEEVSGETSRKLVLNTDNTGPIILNISLFIPSILDDQLQDLIDLIRGMFKTKID